MADLVALRRRLRRDRIFMPRIHLNGVSDDDVCSRFRFHPQTLHFIETLIEPLLPIRTTRRNCALTCLQQLLLTIRFLATGAFFRLIGDSVGVSESQTSRCVYDVCKAIASVANVFVTFPSGSDARKVKQEFYNIAGFPNVLSCVDGTFIRIQAPAENDADFVNRKGFHSLNIQMVCDSNFRITNVVARWPGSVHDARIFRNSHLCSKFENGEYDGIVLGDSGYPCLPFLMTLYNSIESDSHQRFNDALCKTRVRIEQTFGILKRRFSCLSSGLRVNPEKACVITLACAVLHNIGIHRNDIVNYNDNDGENYIDSNYVFNEISVSGNSFRNSIRTLFFS